MKTRVNLYHPKFHPRLNLLTLPIAIVRWILAALFFIALNFYVTSVQPETKSEIAKLNENKQQQKIVVKELQSAVDKLIIDPKLLRQVAKNQQLISLKKRVLNELASLEGLKSNGFSSLMIDLASHNQSGLWLTHINLDGMSVLMEGAATDSAIVPKWLISLGQTDYFRGQEFSDTRLYRDPDQQLNFVISTGKEPTLEKDPDND